MDPVDENIASFIARILASTGKPIEIHRLVGYRGGAKKLFDTKSFKRVPKTLEEVKTFLLKYPEFFYIINDVLVSPTALAIEKFVDNYSRTDPNLLDSNTIVFIKKILVAKSPVSLYPLESLRGLIWSKTEASINKFKNKDDLKKFLLRFPDNFIVKKKFVILAEAESILKESIKYFCDKMLEPKGSISLQKLFNFRGSAPKNVQRCIRTMNELAYCLNTVDIILKEEPKKKNAKLSKKNTDSPLPSNKKPEIVTIPSTIIANQCNKNDTNNKTTLSPENVNGLKKSDDITDAATYFCEQLWKGGTCRIMSIEQLYMSKTNATNKVQSICGSNITEFKGFLRRHPDHFIVTSTNVLARRNEPRKRWAPPEPKTQPPMSSMLVNFFKAYIKCDEPVSIDCIFSEVGNCFCQIDGNLIFNDSKELSAFLGMFPDIFYIDGQHVINLLAQNRSNPTNNRSKKVPQTKNNNDITIIPNDKLNNIPNNNNVDWKAEVLKQTTIIDDMDKCRNICENILKREHLIAIDCEGLNLGAEGKLSLLQICKVNGEVYIFDILGLPDMINEGMIQDILESVKIIKVIHDCRNDSANLFHEYDVRLKNIFDTRVAHSLILQHDSSKPSKPIGFNQLCNIYKAPVNIEKDELKDVYKTNPGFWLKRPLSEDMKAYAALDVACLVPYVYNAMMEKLEGMEQMVTDLSFKHSRSGF